jgi:hypothetical protein
MIDRPFLLQEICGSILGIYKSLTNTWMWKLGLRPGQFLFWEYINRNFFALLGQREELRLYSSVQCWGHWHSGSYGRNRRSSPGQAELIAQYGLKKSMVHVSRVSTGLICTIRYKKRFKPRPHLHLIVYFTMNFVHTHRSISVEMSNCLFLSRQFLPGFFCARRSLI